MGDLNEQIRQRNELRARQYQHQDRQYWEARLEANQAQLARLELDLATVLGRLDRIEEILTLREMFAVEAVACGVDGIGFGPCGGCGVCNGGTGV